MLYGGTTLIYSTGKKKLGHPRLFFGGGAKGQVLTPEVLFGNTTAPFVKNPLHNYECYLEYVYEGYFLHTAVATYLCRAVEEFVERKTCKPYEILVVNMPPQHGKSMAITEALPSWYLSKNPLHRVIEISYNRQFAAHFGRRNREKLLHFGAALGTGLAKSPRSSSEFELDNQIGGMLSTGVFAGITGRACNLMVIDDPIKNRREADSERYRDRIFEEWQNTFKTRLAPGAKVVLIQTRWHEDDLAGRILNSEKWVQHINLPCEAEENDPLERPVGAPLAPELGKDAAWLAAYKQSFESKEGTRTWNALFQGRPSAAQGEILKRSWWQFYQYNAPPNITQAVISVDAAFKNTPSSDYVSVQTWGRHGVKIYLLAEDTRRMSFTETLNAIRTASRACPTAAILIEDKANGSAIIDILAKEFVQILPVEPKGGKIARVNAISAAIEAGNVYLPEGAPFTGRFVEECAAFPNGTHDDRVDAMSQALNRLVLHSWAQEEKEKPKRKLPKELETEQHYTGGVMNW